MYFGVLKFPKPLSSMLFCLEIPWKILFYGQLTGIMTGSVFKGLFSPLIFFRPMLSQVLGTEPYVVKRHWAKINCQEKSWKSQCVEWELLRNESKNSNQMLQMKVPLFSVMLPWFLHACSFHSDKVLVTFL